MSDLAIKKTRREQRQRRRLRIRIQSSASLPRLSVFRSLKHISAQLIDDESGKTLASASDYGKKKKSKKARSTRKEHAYAVGEDIAKRALALGISKIIFDRGPRRYHGVIKSLAEGARAGGLIF